jgi:hypothetical protein
MSTSKRSLVFGAFSGVIWSLAPMALTELWRSPGEMASVLFAGVITGMAVTLLLAWPLLRSEHWTAAAIGAASLPLGAFLFGVIASCVHLGIAQVAGIPYRFVEHRFEALRVGQDYALGVLIPWIAVVLFPAAIVTTRFCHRILHGFDICGD